ncbi:phosphotriesterase family protein [Lysinibacter cavernae]|uniref:Phosphotriesterase-related protein n=1 Tax=Lysinibacter cavernae TaxID=1640652 RepID=A0A7X5R354_9MICO|nr:phosphotriesterase-related protein [Lysinibacter cavernae]
MSPHTVNGDVELPLAGIILPHEHLVINHTQMRGRAAPPTRAIEGQCVELLTGLRTKGVAAVVDCTPPGYGRDLAFLQAVSRSSGMPIISSTGTFCEQWGPQPQWVEASTADGLADAFEAELMRASGIIKVAISSTPTDAEHVALRAAAEAHSRTGAAIVTHTTGGHGHTALDVFERHGVDLGRVMISHVCAEDEPVSYAIELANRGARVGLDRLGHSAHSDEYWVGIIEALVDAGAADRILLSHDSVQQFIGPDAITEATFSRIDHLVTDFRERFFASRLTPDHFQQITEANPRDWLSTNRAHS